MALSWVPKLKSDPTAQEARKWLEEMRRAVAINHPNQLVVQTVQYACQLQPAIFKVVAPTLTAVTAHTSAEVAKKMDEILMTQWTLDVRGMPQAIAIAFAIVQDAVVANSMNEILLENNSDWVANNDGTSKPQGYLCAHRATKAIVDTFITNRLGSGQDVDRSAETRRNAAQKELEDLEFATNVSLPEFHMNFNKMVKNCKNEGCTPLSDLQLTVKYLAKAKKHPIFAPSVLLMNAGSMHYPENTVEALKKLSEIEVLTKDIPHGFVVTGSDKSSGPMPAFVLATRVMTKGEKATTETIPRLSSQNSARTYITKSDGSRRVSKSDWNNMTDEEKDQLIRENKAIRDKSNDPVETKSTKKAALMVSQEANGEFSDDELVLDPTFMYGGPKALMVTKREKAQVQYDEFMSNYGTKTQQGMQSSDAGQMLIRDSTTAPTTMSITMEQIEAAIVAAANTAALRALDVMTSRDAASNRGAQSAQIRGVPQLCDSIDDYAIVEKLLTPSVVLPVSARIPTWVLLIFVCATVLLALWWRLTVTSSDEGCTGDV